MPTARPATTPPRRDRQDWLVGLGIGLATLGLGVGVWFYTQKPSEDPARPRPAWVDLGRMTPQLSDGSFVRVEVSLQVSDKDAQAVLAPLTPAFKSMVTQLGAELSAEDVIGPDGMREMSREIRRSVNDHLARQHIDARVQRVAFSDYVLVP
ncbi:flagellar basal body-associated FliL family protein [uncultured Aquabacterium sp.]|jgi:flagellar basal body-associated protein FliL|uniref:flagellar basal body-associated FliL family protein n=1 Tax=uncultured Aquabacterium sp. TaxID=158753 RepID=UPI0026335DA2|nr:flagellar basal body-associated FliL family protein [uncultured Aquabacterium sp.]